MMRRSQPSAPHPVRPARPPRRAGVALLAGFLALLLTSCMEDARTIQLVPIPMPEGGSIYTIALIDQPSRLDVIAPTYAGIYVHPNDAGPWQLVPAHTDVRVAGAPRGTLPDDASMGYSWSGGALNFRPAELFTAHDARLWIAPGASLVDNQKLVVSEDMGQTWTRIALPSLAAHDHTAPVATQDAAGDNAAGDAAAKNSRLAPPAPDADEPAAPDVAHGAPSPTDTLAKPNSAYLRFANLGADGLFLLGQSALWRLTAPPEDSLLARTDDTSPWAPVSLAGIEFDTISERTRLPRVLRQYLPASAARPFELAMVLRDQLYIYRRDAGQPAFNNVSVLDGADFQLQAIPDSDILFLLGSEGIFRSQDQGGTWEQLNRLGMGHDSTSGVAMQVISASDTEPAALLVALDTGAIYRSGDLGETFQEVRPPDVDRRGVTEFAYSSRRDRLWAATRGAGVLRSLDRGRTWHPINEKLRANRPLDIDVDHSDGFLLGSDAGLYRLSGTPREGRWQMLLNRATTAIHVEPDSGVVLSGTTTGAIVRLEPDGKSSASQAAPQDNDDAVGYQAFRFRGIETPAQAIVKIAPRPDNSRVYAWSARRGPTLSLDAGVSWTPMALNPAFQSALEGSYISNFTTDFGDRIYLMTHGLNESAATQLWRSYNHGDTWHAVSSFPRGRQQAEVFVDRSADFPPETLFIAHQNRFARSVDGGSSWRNLLGPWNDGRITFYTLMQDQHLLILEAYQTTQLLRVSDTDQDRPATRTYDFRWPQGQRAQHDEIRKLALQGGYVFLSTDRSVLVGALPDGSQRLPNGLAMLVTFLSVFTLTLIGYIVLRMAR